VGECVYQVIKIYISKPSFIVLPEDTSNFKSTTPTDDIKLKVEKTLLSLGDE
jgi:hypothetical protein